MSAHLANHNYMDSHVEQFLLQAKSKALGTISKDGVCNVVPVSTIKIVTGKIILVNYFMDKTLANILENNHVTLVAWSDMYGYQVKGVAEYKTSGNWFNEIVVWVKEILPERIVKGIIIIDPKEVYDIAPTKDTKGKFNA